MVVLYFELGTNFAHLISGSDSVQILISGVLFISSFVEVIAR